MKLLSFVLLAISFNATASFENFKELYNKIVYPGHEMRLEYKEYKVEDPYGIGTNQVMRDLLRSGYSIGLIDMELADIDYWGKPVYEVVKKIGKKIDFSGYFCHRYHEDSDYSDVSVNTCTEKTSLLLETLIAENGVNKISVLTMFGNYYGDWETVYVITEKFKTNETIVLELDILHEI